MPKVQKTNKTKEKDPVLAEIENDDTPIDDKGNPIKPDTGPSLEELLSKDPDTLTAADMDILSDSKDDLTDEQKVAVGLMDGEEIDEETPEEEETPAPKIPPKEEPKEETDDQKEQRYKSQQTEAQIQAERNKALLDKIEESANIAPPTDEELQSFVKQDGVEWDELTTFEQATARRTFMAEKRSQLLSDAVKVQKEASEWAKNIDDFIDSTYGKPEFIDLSSHEADFRKFSMKEAHRGTPVPILLSAFLHDLPPEAPKRGSLFPKGGGGEMDKPKEGITDADYAAKLRRDNPKEYKRLLKQGKIKLEI